MNLESSACVYVIIVTTAGPEAYFKIGHSTCIEDRIGGVQTGCPLPIERVLHLPTVDHVQAQAIERSLHARFRKRHTSGEWFAFNIEAEADKREFHDGCDAVIRPKLGSGWQWSPYKVNELRRAGAALSRRNGESKAKAAIAAQDSREERAARIRRGLAPGFWNSPGRR